MDKFGGHRHPGESGREFASDTDYNAARDATSSVNGLESFDRKAPQLPRVSVIFISCGRPDTLRQVVDLLALQTLPPQEVIISVVELSDVVGIGTRDDIKIVYGPKGACSQRNSALRALSPSTDIVVFFDDDFLAHSNWIEGAVNCFADSSEVACVTGYLLADGVRTGGIELKDGLDIINRYSGDRSAYRHSDYSPYGCNMAFRRSALDRLRFDERLVLYGWLEDRDFGASVVKRGGKQVKVGASVGVHLGVTRGRMSGHRLGYSQIVNPIYLRRKGNMSLSCVADHLVRNVGMNIVRSLWSESHIDRRGRLTGNIRGLIDVLRGILEPERAARFG